MLLSGLSRNFELANNKKLSYFGAVLPIPVVIFPPGFPAEKIVRLDEIKILL
jgi:hypothetical protein